MKLVTILLLLSSPLWAVFRSATTNNGASGTVSVTVPPGATAGSIVILAASVDDPAANFQQSAWPTGFTRCGEDTGMTLDGESAGIGWKRLTGADTGSYTFGDLTTNSPWIAQALLFDGRSATANPVCSTATANNTGNASPVSIIAPSQTALLGDDMVWLSTPDVTATGIGNGHTAPPGFTIRLDNENGFVNQAMATRDNVTAGPTGTLTGSLLLTSGTSGWDAFSVRIPVATPVLRGAKLRREHLFTIVSAPSRHRVIISGR